MNRLSEQPCVFQQGRALIYTPNLTKNMVSPEKYQSHELAFTCPDLNMMWEHVEKNGMKSV